MPSNTDSAALGKAGSLIAPQPLPKVPQKHVSPVPQEPPVWRTRSSCIVLSEKSEAKSDKMGEMTGDRIT